MDEQAPNKQRQEFGPVVGAVIIVGLLILGGLYFLLMQEQKLNGGEGPAPDVPLPEQQTNA